MAFLYWIHLPTHTDIFTEGYVGVTTKAPEKRFSQHKSVAKTGNLPISRALRKHGDSVVFEVILIGEENYCYDLESRLRPTDRLGWNCASGGASTLKGFKHSEETKRRISQVQIGKKLSEETKRKLSISSRKLRHSEETKALLSKIAKSRKIPAHVMDSLFESRRNMRPWQNPNSNKTVWASADKFYELYMENPNELLHKIAEQLGFSRSQVSVMHRMVKSGWIPTEDAQWLLNFK
jgi:group I intron endonuclease